MGVCDPLELTACIMNVNVVSRTDTLHLTCFPSLARMTNWTSIHEYFRLFWITWYCMEKLGIVGQCPAPQRCSRVAYSVPGLTQTPVGRRGGRCPGPFFSCPAWKWEWQYWVSPPLPDAARALVKILCCCYQNLHFSEVFGRDPALTQTEASVSLQDQYLFPYCRTTPWDCF